MRGIISPAVIAGACIVDATAYAAPVKLSKDQLSKITAGAITQTNNGGNTPNGPANGIPATNPTGYAPPSQNK